MYGVYILYVYIQKTYLCIHTWIHTPNTYTHGKRMCVGTQNTHVYTHTYNNDMNCVRQFVLCICVCACVCVCKRVRVFISGGVFTVDCPGGAF